MGVHRTDRWHELSVASEALRDNPLGDPHVRPLWVWAPADEGRRYPSVYVLQSFTGVVGEWFNVRPWEESFPDAVERLAPQAVVVLVDAFTAVGGSQFLDSPAIGRYHTYLCEEVVPFVDARFPTAAEPARRGLQGHSSGGYGAVVTTLLRSDLFGAFASHAGDALFDVSFARQFAPVARALRDRYRGSYAAFWSDFRSGRPVLATADDHLLLGVYAAAAAYSARHDGAVDLPFDVETGAVLPEVFERWLRWDPVRMVREAQRAAALRGLRGAWIDAGASDEAYLDLAATALRRALADAGVPDDAVRFELFPGRHSGIRWRYPLALEWLVERLASPT